MSNAIVKKEKETWELAGVPAPIWSALKSSLYPGAKDESILMVWDYCKGANLDPLQKPVHIVPMWVVDKKTNEGMMRDVVMPGIGLYRIQAERSGRYAGITEPEFGPNITEKLGDTEFTYPEWCKVTVKKFMDGKIFEYTAKEFWIENYANSGKDKITKKVNYAPNEMWRKRKHGQLAKCTEAQALRKAFPDLVSQAPTAEEMEGKTIEGDYEEVHNKKVRATERLLKEIQPVAKAPTMQEMLTSMVIEYEVSQEEVDKWLKKAKVNRLDELNDDQTQKCINYISEKYIDKNAATLALHVAGDKQNDNERKDNE